jgi:hypothetical protein
MRRPRRILATAVALTLGATAGAMGGRQSDPHTAGRTPKTTEVKSAEDVRFINVVDAWRCA